MLYHCKVIDKNEQDKEKLCIRKLDLMRQLLYSRMNMSLAILKDEIYNMQKKFDKYLCLVDVKDIDYDKMFKDHIPNYEEGLYAGLDVDYFENNKYYVQVLYSSKHPQLAFVYSYTRNKFNYHACEVKNMPVEMYCDQEYEFSLTKKELSKYEFTRKTLGLYYVNLKVVHFNLYSRENNVFKQNAPAWITKLEFITDNFYLYELLKYLRKQTKVYRYIEKLLSNGGLKENEFVYLGHLEGDE